jgi:hypothetical protein
MSEYERQQPENYERVTHEWFGLVVICLAAFSGTCIALNLSVSRYIWQPNLGIYSESLQQIAAEAHSIETIFVGSSHFAMGLDPSVFDGVILESGATNESHMVSVLGMSYQWTKKALQDIAAKDLKKLRFVIVEPRLYVMPVRSNNNYIFGNVFTQRSRFINNLGNLGEQLSMLAALKISTKEKFRLYLELSYATLISASNIGVNRDLFLPVVSTGPETTALWDSRRGYKVTMSISDKAFQSAIDSDAGFREISELERQALLQLVEQIESMGATPLFLLPPSRMDVGLQRATRDALLTLVPHEQVLDFTYAPEPHDIYKQQALWRDQEHLNSKGSMVLSALVADYWAATFRDKRSAR